MCAPRFPSSIKAENGWCEPCFPLNMSNMFALYWLVCSNWRCDRVKFIRVDYMPNVIARTEMMCCWLASEPCWTWLLLSCLLTQKIHLTITFHSCLFFHIRFQGSFVHCYTAVRIWPTVFWKKANETQKILIKIKHSSFSFFFFLPKSACLCCFFQLVVLEQLLQCPLAAGFICTAALCPSHNFILTVS